MKFKKIKECFKIFEKSSYTSVLFVVQYVQNLMKKIISQLVIAIFEVYEYL